MLIHAAPSSHLIVGDNSHALQLAEKLRQQGCWVTAIRPPSPYPLVLRDCAYNANRRA
ncbi:hypothetical protein ACNKHV_04470 [Shigella flexneri]